MNDGSGTTRCELSFNVDDSRRSIVELTRRFSLLDDADPRACVIDASRSQYLGPWAVAAIMSIVMDKKHRGVKVDVNLPHKPPELAAFCAFSGLRHHLLGEAEPDQGHPENETLPLFLSERSSFYAPNSLVRLIQRHTDLSADDEDQLRVCLNEVHQNVSDHSKSEIGSVTSARYFVQKREVRVGIVDRGLGIGTTLRRKHDVPNDTDALRKVVQGGLTSGSRSGNRGLGI